MTEEANKPTESSPANAAAKANDDSTQIADMASQSSDCSEETLVIRRLVVPQRMPELADSDDDRSPGVVDRAGVGSSKAADVPIVQKIVVPTPDSTSSDSDDGYASN